jgi:gliding motility-associated transport system ATP-binding protein
MIEVEHLSKWYGNFHALRDISFNVEKGEILGFLGPNGAGKTTTMRIITGYIPATEGRISVAGFDVAEKSLDARKHLGYLPETVPLYTEFTALEYLDFRGRIDGMHNGRERKARIHEVMDRLNILDVANKQIGALSRGYRQRVGLAQAMLHNPDVLILDEPTVGLDPVQITGVRELIKELGQDHTIVLSTHLLAEVSMVCNRVLIINRGHLVAFDTPLHLSDTGHETQAVHVEAAGAPTNILAVIKAVAGVTSVSVVNGDGAQPTDGAALGEGVYTYQVQGTTGTDIRSAVASAVVGAGKLFELRVYRPTLEDAFISAISQDDEAEIEAEQYYDEDASEEGGEEDSEPVAAGVAEETPHETTVAAPRSKVVTKRRSRG